MKPSERIKNLYRISELQDSRDFEMTSVSFKVKAETASMLSCIAEHFSTNRHAFGGEILDDYCLKMFQAISPDDQLELASKADLMTSKILSTKHKRDIKDPSWSSLAAVLHRDSYSLSSEKDGE